MEPVPMNPVNLGAKLATILLIEPAGTPNTGDPATAAARRVI
jgi:hypothetical protein